MTKFLSRLAVAATLLFCCQLQASWITNSFRAPDGSSSNILVQFVPVPGSTPYTLTNGVIIYSSAVKATATNGILSPTWVEVGNYNVSVGPLRDALQANVPYDSNTYALWVVATNVYSSTNFPFLPGVSSIVAGANVTVANSGPVYTISSTGGGGAWTGSIATGITNTGTQGVTNAGPLTNGGSIFDLGSFTVSGTNSITNALGSAAFQLSTFFYQTNQNLQAGAVALSNLVAFLSQALNAAGFTNLPLAGVQTNGGFNGWMASQSNNVSGWTKNGGAITNLAAAQLQGTIPASSLQIATNNLNFALTNLSSIQIATNNLNTALTNNNSGAATFQSTVAAASFSGTGASSLNLVSSTNLPAAGVQTNGGFNGWLFGQSNNAGIWTQDGGGLTNLTGANISGPIIVSVVSNTPMTNIPSENVTNINAVASLQVQGSNVYTLLPGNALTFTTNGNEMTVAASLQIATNNLNTVLTNFNVVAVTVSNLVTLTNNTSVNLLQITGGNISNSFGTNFEVITKSGIVEATMTNDQFITDANGALTTSNITASGAVTAGSFVGNGVTLTNIQGSNVVFNTLGSGSSSSPTANMAYGAVGTVGTNSQSGNFTFGAPLNVNVTSVGAFSSFVMNVTNTSGSPIVATGLAVWKTNAVASGGWSITNDAVFTFSVFYGFYTNVLYLPIN